MARVGAVRVEERQVFNLDNVIIVLPAGPFERFEHRIHFSGGGVIQRLLDIVTRASRRVSCPFPATLAIASLISRLRPADLALVWFQGANSIAPLKLVIASWGGLLGSWANPITIQTLRKFGSIFSGFARTLNCFPKLFCRRAWSGTMPQ